MNNVLVTGLCLAIGAVILDIIGTAIPFWWSVKSGYTLYSYGLFKVCVAIQGISSCASYGSIASDWIKATRAMMILSILALSAGIFLAVLFGFVKKEMKILALGAALSTAAGAGLALLGVIIFVTNIKKTVDSGNVYIGFGLVIVAILMSVGASVMMLISRTRTVLRV